MVEVLTTIRVTHLHLILLNNLSDLIHDDWKHTDTDHHANDRDYHLKVTYWVKVAVTNGGEHGQREIQTGYKLIVDGLFIKLKYVVPRFSLITLQRTRDKEPGATKEESA